MAEASYQDAYAFLKQLQSCMDQGRCAESFFRILCNEDALRQKVRKNLTRPCLHLRYSIECFVVLTFALLLHLQFLGYGTALDGKIPHLHTSFPNFHVVFSWHCSKHSSWCDRRHRQEMASRFLLLHSVTRLILNATNVASLGLTSL